MKAENPSGTAEKRAASMLKEAGYASDPSYVEADAPLKRKRGGRITGKAPERRPDRRARGGGTKESITDRPAPKGENGEDSENPFGELDAKPDRRARGGETKGKKPAVKIMINAGPTSDPQREQMAAHAGMQQGMQMGAKMAAQRPPMPPPGGPPGAPPGGPPMPPPGGMPPGGMPPPGMHKRGGHVRRAKGGKVPADMEHEARKGEGDEPEGGFRRGGKVKRAEGGETPMNDERESARDGGTEPAGGFKRGGDVLVKEHTRRARGGKMPC